MELTVNELATLIARDKTAEPSSPATAHPFIGRYVICRCTGAGVHAGTLDAVNGDECILSGSRRLWQWQTNGGVALSGLAVHGLKAGKIDSRLDRIAVRGVCEIIPATDVCRGSIDEHK